MWLKLDLMVLGWPQQCYYDLMVVTGNDIVVVHAAVDEDGTMVKAV